MRSATMCTSLAFVLAYAGELYRLGGNGIYLLNVDVSALKVGGGSVTITRIATHDAVSRITNTYTRSSSKSSSSSKTNNY